MAACIEGTLVLPAAMRLMCYVTQTGIKKQTATTKIDTKNEN